MNNNQIIASSERWNLEVRLCKAGNPGDRPMKSIAVFTPPIDTVARPLGIERGLLGAAPEQLQGRSSPATDVHSFTAVVFEMCTGVRYRSLADGTEDGLRRALSGFSTGFLTELSRGLAHNPEMRPQDIDEYVALLAGHLRSY